MASARIRRPGSSIDFTYNARNWLTGVLNRTYPAGDTLYDVTYAYSDGGLWDHTGNPLKRTESLAGATYDTTFRYDRLYQLTEETKRDSGSNVLYSRLYGYDSVGNRTSLTKDGTAYTYTYAPNSDRLASISGGGQSASFGYDLNGNMTDLSGTLFGIKSMLYNDANALTSLTSGGVTDLYYYNALGQRYRARLNGTLWRYVYNGDRVLEETYDGGSVLLRYTTTNPSFFAPWLHQWRSGGTARYPLYDATGSARELVDNYGAVTDTYSLDAFGVKTAADTGTTQNPYHYDAAWGYVTDPSGFQQLGYRFYWPEIGRFLQQDPIGDGMNWYAYAENSPLALIDPEGLDALDNATNFFAGFGDTLTFGGTAVLRGWMGTDGVVNQGAGMYRAGEWTGVGYGLLMGGAQGLKAAGTKAAGKEFSHWIPARAGRALGGRLGRFIAGKSIWNGNYVPKEVHALSDPCRYRFMPKAWKGLNPMLNPLAAAWVRLPNLLKGIGAGIGFGAASGAANDR